MNISETKWAVFHETDTYVNWFNSSYYFFIKFANKYSTKQTKCDFT